MKIRLVDVTVMHTDRWTDVTTLTIAFRLRRRQKLNEMFWKLCIFVLNVLGSTPFGPAR